MSKHCCEEHHHAAHTASHQHGPSPVLQNPGNQKRQIAKEVLQVAVVAMLFGIGFFFEQPLRNTPFSIGEYLVLVPAYLISGWGVLTSAGRNLLKGKFFDENFLMAVATLGAIAIHKIPEAVAVMLFFRIGELFQDYSVDQSRRSIQALLAVRPDTANLSINGSIQSVSPTLVQIGNTILVRPGERIPLDGEILDGQSQVDTSALTGESMHRTVTIGDVVLAGMINHSGVLLVKVIRMFAESSVAKILDLVENASSKKARTQKFITQFARYYTPIVVLISLAVAVIPPFVFSGTTSAQWIYRALTLLVISCPCGLVISIPLGYFGGVGGAARRGILIKGATFLDTLTQVNIVVFDKTGTLTQGVFQVVDIVPQNGVTSDQLLSLAAKVESHSQHPIAKSIREAYGQPLNCFDLKDYTEIAGQGVRAVIDGQTISAGNKRFLELHNIDVECCTASGTVVHLGIQRYYAGYIVIADKLKEDAVEAIQSLRDLGIHQISMLTGDNHTVASDVASQLGLDSYQANLLPEQKLEAIETLLTTADKNTVVFVGDGINDAPVIARANIGMAMGGLGSDAAIETADIVIMTDAPSKITEAIQIARGTRVIVWQNIILALTVKGFFIILGTLGFATLWEAVFADVGVALAAIFNATRVMEMSKPKVKSYT